MIHHLQKLTATGDELYAKVCTVHRVDKENKCCDVIPVDGTAELFDVPFHPSEEDAGLCLYPTEKSHVLVVFMGKHHACICQLSEVDLMKLQIDKVEFSADKDGFLLKKDTETLKKLMADLLEAIAAITMISGEKGTPTSEPVNKAKFKAIQTRFNSLLKDE